MSVLPKRPFPTLIFTITTLYFFVDPFLHLTFEYTCSRWLVEPSYFENMCSIDPIISPPSHNAVAVEFKLVDRNLIRDIRHTI